MVDCSKVLNNSNAFSIQHLTFNLRDAGFGLELELPSVEFAPRHVTKKTSTNNRKSVKLNKHTNTHTQM